MKTFLIITLCVIVGLGFRDFIDSIRHIKDDINSIALDTSKDNIKADLDNIKEKLEGLKEEDEKADTPSSEAPIARFSVQTFDDDGRPAEVLTDEAYRAK